MTEIEMQAIKDEAIKNGTFMKAPNGKPTNLNERQWLQVRTKAFKKWFGDWEKAAIVKAIRKLSAVPEKSLEDGETYESVYKNIGNATNENDGTTVRFFNTAFKKIVKEGGLSERSIPSLKDAFEKAVLAYTETDKLGGEDRKDGTKHKEHKNIDEYRNYIGKVTIDGDVHYVRFTATMQKGNNGIHSFFVTNIDVYENAKGNTSFKDLLQTSVSSDGVIDTKLQKFFEEANEAEKNSSKIVDENGEPSL